MISLLTPTVLLGLWIGRRWWKRRHLKRPVPHFQHPALYMGAMRIGRKTLFCIDAPNDRVCAEYLAWLCTNVGSRR